MPELRQDIITGRWVVIATNRAKRPDMMSVQRTSTVPKETSCPFCGGHEALTPPEVDAIRENGSRPNESGWTVRAVPNKFPAFGEDNEPVNADAFYALQPALGSHEVIIHCPEHAAGLADLSVDQIIQVLKLYKKRYEAKMDDPAVKSTLIIVNHGREAGASLEHTHSQLFAMPLVPAEIRTEYDAMDRHNSENNDCVFCDMIVHERELATRIVAENNNFVSFCPYASRGPFETWILPKNHLGSFESSSDETIADFARILKRVLGKLREKLNDPPYNYWLHSRPAADGDFHWHLEIMPKLSIAAGFEMGTGVMINVVRPEDAADYLRIP